MKSLHRLFMALAAASLVSCATFQFDQAQLRPAASIATVAFLERTSPAQRPKRLAELRAAVVKIQQVALSETPTAEALAVALNEVSSDPAWTSLATALVRSFRPTEDRLATPEAQAALVNLSEGILDTVQTYERAASNK